jgi:signal transduction histidine kinase
MKISSQELGEIGRKHIVLTPLILLCFLLGPIIFAAAAQSRLASVDERVHNLHMRQQALSQFLALIAAAESSQRGFLLTGENSYLQLYVDGTGKVLPALDNVRTSFNSGHDSGGDIRVLKQLTEQELAAMAETIALRQQNAAAPLAPLRIDAGEEGMERIVNFVGGLLQNETREVLAATEQWRSQLELTRWITAIGALIDIGLVLLATRLTYDDMRRRGRQAGDLRDQKEELERQAALRTAELTALSTHLQGVSEQEKSALSRELHDELGGLLVAARMDVSWLQQRLPTSDQAIEQRFKRIHEYLSAGVDLKRRVVEELRPTLLDNMGLFAALRWQFKETCRRSGLRCSEQIPEAEMKFHPDAAIGVFRVAQEAMTNILKHAEASSADLTIEINENTLSLQISDDGKGFAANRLQTGTSHGLTAMRHRITALGGTWEIQSLSPAGTMVTALIPLERMLPTDMSSAIG